MCVQGRGGLVRPNGGGRWQVSLKVAEATTRWKGCPAPAQQSPEAQRLMLAFPGHRHETHGSDPAPALGEHSQPIHSCLLRASLSSWPYLSVKGVWPATLRFKDWGGVWGRGWEGTFCCLLMSLRGCWAG